MAEHTLKFPKGTWVKGLTTEADHFDHGLLIRVDENDGEHFVRLFPKSADPKDWASFYEDEENENVWATPGDIEKDEPPEWFGGNATHAFVYDWMDDHVPNVSLHTDPSDIIGAYFSDATADECAALNIKLMEAVVDPGERIELAPGGGGVRFCVVNG